MLVAITSQVLHDFDTYGLDSAYSSLLHSFVHAIRTYVVDICGVTTQFVSLPPIWIYDMVYALHFIFIVFACVWGCAWVYVVQTKGSCPIFIRIQRLF